MGRLFRQRINMETTDLNAIDQMDQPYREHSVQEQNIHYSKAQEERFLGQTIG